jgi:hypothetical protein
MLGPAAQAFVELVTNKALKFIFFLLVIGIAQFPFQMLPGNLSHAPDASDTR